MTSATTEHGSATRDRIVRVATGLIIDFGVDGITIRDVLAEARVSASQVYHYFQSKDGLIAAVIAEQSRSRPDAPDSLDALREWCERFVRTVELHGCTGDCGLVLLTGTGEDTSDELRPRWASALDWWEGPLRDGLGAMRARGVFPADTDTDAFATALLAALHGGLVLSRFRDSVSPLRIVLDAVLTHIDDASVSIDAHQVA